MGNGKENITCARCNHRQNLPINFLCVNCQRLIIKLTWLHGVYLVLSLTIIGIIIGLFKAPLVLGIYSEVLFLIVLYLVFRKDNFQIAFVITYSIALTPFVIISYFNFWNIPILPDISMIFLVILFIILLVVLFTYWIEVCRDNDVVILEYLSVLTFSAWLLSIILSLIVNTLGYIDELFNSILEFRIITVDSKLFEYAKSYTNLRMFFLVLTIIVVIFVSFFKALKREIPRPKQLFNLNNNQLFGKAHHPSFFIGIIIVLFETIIINIKIILNYIKTTLEIFYNFLRNLSIEIYEMFKINIKIIIELNRYFYKHYIFPILILLLILYQLMFTSERIVFYIHGNGLDLTVILHYLSITIATAMYVIFSTDYDKTESTYSILASLAFVAFFILIFSFLNSFILLLLSQLFKSLPYKNIGYYTIIIFIAIAILSITAYVSDRIKTKKAINSN